MSLPEPASQPPVPAPAPRPAPVPRSAAAPAGRYTHRTWKDEMGDVLAHIAQIHAAFQLVEQGLEVVEAGRTQLQLVGDCRETGLRLMQQGVGIVEATDDRYQPIHDAIRLAGGHDEVARDKHYHDR